MAKASSKKGFFRSRNLFLGAVLIWLLVAATWNHFRALPEGLDFEGPARSATDVKFLADITYSNPNGRQIEQSIFDEVFALIAQAEHFILVDMFLFNDFQGEIPENHRPLSSELVERLVTQKQRYPDMQILVLSDPLNTLYGGLESDHWSTLEAAGIPVTATDLTELRDSNPLYSTLWRPFIQPFGNSPGGGLPSPFGEGEVSVRSYLALLNFKANHRKLIITDRDDSYAALVTSANPHDGSSAHGNVALRFSGQAVADLLQSERAVLAFSEGPEPRVPITNAFHQDASTDDEEPLSLQVLTERAVERAILESLARAKAGDRVDLAVFYLSDRHVVDALKDAQQRGVKLRLLLDPNKDAFGRTKDGVPNRPVAHELAQAGVDIRWCATQGEQCHAKLLMARYADLSARLLLGSSNFTRRNLDNLNLETSVLLMGRVEAEPFQEANDWFEQQWGNPPDRQFSVDYDVYADSGLWPRIKYRFMEATGLSTF